MVLRLGSYYYTNREFDLLTCLFGKMHLFTWNKIMNYIPHHVLYSIVLANSNYSNRFFLYISTLDVKLDTNKTCMFKGDWTTWS